MAKQDLEEKYPGRKMYVIDSIAASSGYGLLIDILADYRDKGFTAQEIVAEAEGIKMKVGTAVEEADPRMMEIKGRNILTGLPKTITLTSEEIRVALKDATNQIVELVHGILEKTPPELAADIVDRGIILTGGISSGSVE